MKYEIKVILTSLNGLRPIVDRCMEVMCGNDAEEVRVTVIREDD